VLEKKLAGNPEMRVLMRADKTCATNSPDLLVASATAGVSNVTFSVVDKDNGAPAALPPPRAINNLEKGTYSIWLVLLI